MAVRQDREAVGEDLELAAWLSVRRSRHGDEGPKLARIQRSDQPTAEVPAQPG